MAFLGCYYSCIHQGELHTLLISIFVPYFRTRGLSTFLWPRIICPVTFYFLVSVQVKELSLIQVKVLPRECRLIVKCDFRLFAMYVLQFSVKYQLQWIVIISYLDLILWKNSQRDFKGVTELFVVTNSSGSQIITFLT